MNASGWKALRGSSELSPCVATAPRRRPNYHLVYNFNHNFQKINLDSSFGFSRRAAEAAEYAEKVPNTETFRRCWLVAGGGWLVGRLTRMQGDAGGARSVATDCARTRDKRHSLCRFPDEG